jgi:hypothetical protein
MTVVAAGLSHAKEKGPLPSKRKQARPTMCGASLLVTVYLVLASVVVAAAEQVGHHTGAVIAGMIQAR